MTTPSIAAATAPEDASQPLALRLTARLGALWPTMLGFFLLLLGPVLIYVLYSIWPAALAATGENAARTDISLFGGLLSLSPNPDSALILLVITTSALGSYVHAATSFTTYLGNRRLVRTWVWWYILRVLIGAALALLFYFAVRGGFFADADSDSVNPYGIAALSGLVGLFSKQATDKLRETFDTLFKTAKGYGDDARADAVDNPKPTLITVDPTTVTRGTLSTLKLYGGGFTQDSQVRVARAVGATPTVLEGRTEFVDERTLNVSLNDSDLAGATVLYLTVYNPEPGGGVAGPLLIEIADSGAGAPDEGGVEP